MLVFPVHSVYLYLCLLVTELLQKVIAPFKGHLIVPCNIQQYGSLWQANPRKHGPSLLPSRRQDDRLEVEDHAQELGTFLHLKGITLRFSHLSEVIQQSQVVEDISIDISIKTANTLKTNCPLKYP